MALLTESRVRARAQTAVAARTYQTVASVLNERMEKQVSSVSHDIFLSHAYEDREMVLGAALVLQDFGYSVYIDWRDDPMLDRKNVTSVTAAKLRERMKASKCLFYSVTPSATESAWMKWELGFKDADNNRVAILPIVNSTADNYGGQQFLGLYPFVSDGKSTNSPENRLWIHRSPSLYIRFEEWLKGKNPPEI